jgi:hypothetical protein
VNVCSPIARAVYVAGEVQTVKAAPSSAHSKVDPGSLAEKLNMALVSVVVASGAEVIAVSGAVVSGGAVTVQV